MRSLLRRQPAVFVSLLFCLVILILYSIIVRQKGGVFLYPLDDSYIHLALARTLVLHHVWGIDATIFASASSSPGWTLLLAAIDVLIGPHLLNGIALNVIFAIAVLFAVDYGIRGFAPSTALSLRYLALLVILFGTPLTCLTMIGMEHVAQALSMLLFVILATQILVLESGSPAPRGKVVLLLLAAFFAGAIRYEAVFAVAIVCLCLLLRRRALIAVMVAFCAAVAPIAFGIYFHHESGLWFPFSVIAKAAGQPPASVKYFLNQTHGFRSLIPVIVIVWLLRLRRFRFWHASQLLLFFAFCITVLHLAIAPVGWLMRYESYLAALCLFSLLVVAATLPSRQAILECIRQSSRRRQYATALLAILLIGLGFDMVHRAVQGVIDPVRASDDRFLEHMQMARFVSNAYDHDTIVVNDIGTIAYYTHAHLLDLIGLGSIEPVRAIHNKHPFTAADVDAWALSQHTSIAILQTQWRLVSRVIPPSWTRVQTWTIPRNVAFKDFDISFFAITPQQIPRLCASLARLQPPPQDKVTPLAPVCSAPPPATLPAHPGRWFSRKTASTSDYAASNPLRKE